jgi:hypothetical protein
VRQPAACSASFLRCPSTDPRVARPRRDTRRQGRVPRSAGAVTRPAVCNTSSRRGSEHAALLQQWRQGAWACGQWPCGADSEGAEIDCYAVSRIVPDKVGTIQRIRRPTRDEDLPSFVVGAAHGSVGTVAVIAAALGCIVVLSGFDGLTVSLRPLFRTGPEGDDGAGRIKTGRRSPIRPASSTNERNGRRLRAAGSRRQRKQCASFT